MSRAWMVSVLCRGGEDLLLQRNNPMKHGEWRSGRKRPCKTEDEVAHGVQDLQRLKRLRLTDDIVVTDENQDTSDAAMPDTVDEGCKALILRPLAPDEYCFRVAVSSDLPESTLGILLRADRVAPRDQRDKEDTIKGRGDHLGKELVVYQTPSSLPDLIKEAAFLDEHHMELD